ncbi:unnamed protein product [Calypogeia fissa]
MGGCFINWPPASSNILYRKDIDKLFDQVFTNAKDWTRELDGFNMVMLGSVGTAEFYVRRVSGRVTGIHKNYAEGEISRLVLPDGQAGGREVSISRRVSLGEGQGSGRASCW